MGTNWVGKWKGGRVYLDDDAKPVFVIEAMRGSHRYVLKLATHDEDLAVGEFARFVANPVKFAAEHRAAPTAGGPVPPLYITPELIGEYLESIRKTVADHRAARSSQLEGWQEKGLDLRRVEHDVLTKTLKGFTGGHRGRCEAINALGRFLVKTGRLPAWRPIENTTETDPEKARAEREAYSIVQLREAHALIADQAIKDVFALRALTGMHHTEIEQLAGAKVGGGSLPDKGVGIRKLPEGHTIAGVLQVMHKSRRRHRQSVDVFGLAAALRLRESGVPHRIDVWHAIKPLVPSNLRHTFVTLSGEVGELVTYVATGVERARIAQIIGHREGSSMTSDRYDKLQVPPMVRLPLEFT